MLSLRWFGFDGVFFHTGTVWWQQAVHCLKILKTSPAAAWQNIISCCISNQVRGGAHFCLLWACLGRKTRNLKPYLLKWQWHVFVSNWRNQLLGNHHNARGQELNVLHFKHCLYFSSGCMTFVSVSYVPSYICVCLLTQSNYSVNHYSPVCSRSLWRRRPLHSHPASCANSQALR